MTIGISTPLSGGLAGPGGCSLAGLEAYFGEVNAAGGVKFGDGATRRVEITSFDDAYDPGRAVENFQRMVGDRVFLDVGGLGTVTNMAIMPIATAKQMPQVFVQSGSSAFSADRTANPYTIGWAPTYASEGEAFGTFLAESGEPTKVAVLSQNDDFGADFVDGLKRGIEGSAVTIVATATYEATDTSVDAQVTELAGSGADVFFDATTLTPIAIGSLLQAQKVGWFPKVFLPSTTSAPNLILAPANASVFPMVYTSAFAKSALDPAYAEDPEMKKFLAALDKYATTNISTVVPQCVWAYGIGATLTAAFEQLETPTRSALMDVIHRLNDVKVPLLLDGVALDASADGVPPINATVIQQFDGTIFGSAEPYSN
ncbi:ABC transporter substrate-binding protein [Microbacterium elymi]|uniref:ABC transporter substrate-binding protein n=1 Tax=Microbacterium elymi TaxID=2909587 RepID=A0ABY5NGT2_9MICO|nr:ABC transporter substrate-binding protein [Microbacterium elymi]UUT34344.1 ABC transporter substrate-binding protein [Microbacterium elymi]